MLPPPPLFIGRPTLRPTSGSLPRAAPLDASKARKLDLCALPESLEDDSQITQFILQPHSSRVIRLLVQDLVNVRLDLGRLLRRVRGESLRHELDVERGLHELREGDGGQPVGLERLDERGRGGFEEGAQNARGEGRRCGAGFCVDDDEVQQDGEDVGAGLAVCDAPVWGVGPRRPGWREDAGFDCGMDLCGVRPGVGAEQLRVELRKHVADAICLIGELYAEERLEEIEECWCNLRLKGRHVGKGKKQPD